MLMLRLVPAHDAHTPDATIDADSARRDRERRRSRAAHPAATRRRRGALRALSVGAIAAMASACVTTPVKTDRSFTDQIPGQLDYFPVVGSVQYSNDYGAARSGGRSHQGNDVMANRGQQILAVEAGTVSIGASSLSGNRIWLTTDSGAAYFYAHLDGFAPGLTDGARVWGGQLLGYVGSTGNASASAPHLHFEMHPSGRSGASTNPYQYLRGAEARGAVAPVM